MSKWQKISDDHWVRQVDAPFGKLSCELSAATDCSGYLARVTVSQETLLLQDEVHELDDPLSWANAEGWCDEVCSEVLQNNGPLLWSVHIPIQFPKGQSGKTGNG